MKLKRKKPTQINLMVRCIIAMYLIYLAHSIITELDKAANARLMAGFAILFTFTGVLIIAFTIRAFVTKDYRDMRELYDEDGDIPEGKVIDEIVTDDAVIDVKEGKKEEGVAEPDESETAGTDQ